MSISFNQPLSLSSIYPPTLWTPTAPLNHSPSLSLSSISHSLSYPMSISFNQPLSLSSIYPPTLWTTHLPSHPLSARGTQACSTRRWKKTFSHIKQRKNIWWNILLNICFNTKVHVKTAKILSWVQLDTDGKSTCFVAFCENITFWIIILKFEKGI